MTRRLLWMVVCCLPFISGCKQSECAISENAIDDAIYQNLPFDMPKVQQPVFPAYEVNISKFGAKGDGMTLNTKAINDAIKEVNQRGGGKVIIPEGTWLTGPLYGTECTGTLYGGLRSISYYPDFFRRTGHPPLPITDFSTRRREYSHHRIWNI